MQLGPLQPENLEMYLAWRNDPDTYRWCRQYEPLSIEQHHAWYESLSFRPDVRMYEILDKNHNPVGVCGLTDIDEINRRAEFSLYIGTEFRGKRYAKPALAALLDKGFNVINLHLIWGETFEGNSAAVIFENLGFTKEGTRRDFYFRDGKYIDAHLYSITAEEWRRCR